jgi:hypothetical protein
MTEKMLNALREPQESTDEPNAARRAVVAVHIEPNLVPGEPFEATVAIKALPDEPVDNDPANST